MNSKQKIEEIVKEPEYTSTSTKFTLETVKDSIVEQVKTEFDERSAKGQEKYGTTLADNNYDDFIKNIIHFDTTKRPSLDSLLKHPFLN